MARQLILSVTTLVIVGVLFLVYDATTSEPELRLRGVTDDGDANARGGTGGGPNPFAPTQSTTGPGLSIKTAGVNTQVSPGTGVRFELRDESGRIQARISAEVWEPISEREFDLQEPVAELLLPGTQIVTIKADTGRVTVQSGGRSNLDPKSGWLRGNVRIRIDRADDKWREANPDRAEPEQHPELMVRIFMNDINFDFEFSRLDTEGPVRVQSAEADIQGTGLLLRWNESQNRIEELKFDTIQRMELRRGGGDLVRIGMPGARRTSPDHRGRRADRESPAMAAARIPAQGAAAQAILPSQPLANLPVEIERPKPAPKPAPPTTAPAGGAMIQLARERKEKAPQIDTYVARFGGPVRIEQRSGQTVLGTLSAPEALVLTFEYSSQRGKDVAAAPTSQAAADGASSRPATGGDAPRPVVEPTVVLTCEGSLVLTPVDADPDRPPTGERFRVEATGSPVVLTDEQGEARCRKLVYEQHTERAWVEGDATTPAVLSTRDGRRLEANRLFFDGKIGTARLDGAGEMTDIRDLAARVALPGAPPGSPDLPGVAASQPARAGGFRVTWTDRVDLKFEVLRTRVRNAETGRFEIKSRDVLKRATFRGTVVLSQTGQSLSADMIELRFAPPRSPDEVADTLEEIRAVGHVEMQNGDDRIRCRRLVVEMIVDADGENLPRIARALGGVRAEQFGPVPLLAQMLGAAPRRVAHRLITADKQLIVTFGKIRHEAEPFDPAQAKALAREIVSNPTTTDLEKAQAIARYLGDDPEKVDPAKAAARVAQLRDRLDTLDWESIAARRSERSTVVITAIDAAGDVEVRDTQPAEGALEVQAETLHADIAEGKRIETVRITGTDTRMAIATLGDFVIRGHEIDADIPTEQADVVGAGALTFTTAESFDGRKRGKPTPVTITWHRRMALRGQQNTVLFEGQVRAVSEMSVLDCDDALRVDLVATPPPVVAKPAEPSGVTSLWLLRPFLHQGERDDRALASAAYEGRFRKRIVQLVATGNAKILSSDIEPRSGRLAGRTLITGPQIEVDVEKERLNVRGAGSLLIEDYRLPSRRRRTPTGARPASSGSLLRRATASSGPSQTLIQWQSAMSFFLNNNVANFDRTVRLTHVAGSEMRYLDEIVQAMNVDPATLATIESRHVTLAADNYLTASFDRPAQRTAGAGVAQRLGGTELSQFTASGNVQMTVDKTNSLRGERVTYSRDHDLVTIHGTTGRPADFSRHDARSGRYIAWRGPLLKWSPTTDHVDAPGATIVSSSP